MDRAARAAVASDRAADAPPPGEDEQGAVAALLLVLVGLAVVTWVVNPWAAALFVAAAHLWLLFGVPELRLSRGAGLAARGGGRGALRARRRIRRWRSSASDPGEALWFCLLLVAGGNAGPGLWMLWSLLARLLRARRPPGLARPARDRAGAAGGAAGARAR